MRKLLVCLIMLVSVMALFALSGKVTWTWFENDPDVEFYRYQADGEDDANWTVVDKNVNEVTLILDVSKVHVLYLQQSYDGVSWSESSMVESEVFTSFDAPEPEAEVLDEELFDEPEPAEVQQRAEDTPAAEAEQAESESGQVAEEKYVPLRALDYGIGYMNSIPDSAEPKTLGLFASYSRSFKDVGVFRIGLKANASLYSSVRQWRLSSYVNVLAMASAVVGNSDIYIAFGPDLGFTMIKDSDFRAGLSVEMGIRYHRTPRLAFGLSVADHYYLLPAQKDSNRFDLRVFMSSVL